MPMEEEEAALQSLGAVSVAAIILVGGQNPTR